MVLSEGIEPSTSALPRMRSTTELRQQVGWDGRAYGCCGLARQPGLRSARLNISAWGMAKPDPERDARLAAALRDNLRRRKAQGRDAPNEAPQGRELPADQKKDDTQPASE